MQGRDQIEAFWKAAVPALGIEHLVLTTVDVQCVGDQAYEVGCVTLTLGGGQQATGKYVVIWKEEDGAWKWHVDIWNMDA